MPFVEVSFPGSKRIDAVILGHNIPTDQSVANGGEGAAPEPFQLFLASIATCAGIYAKSFCDERRLAAPRSLDMDVARGADGLLTRLDLVLHVEPDFPARYDPAIARAMNLCAVKKELRSELATHIRIVRDA